MDPKISSDGLVAKVINKAMEEGWKMFRSFMGESFWKELADLLEQLMPLREKLLAATDKMNGFLNDPNTVAAVVCVPERDSIAAAQTLVSNWDKKLNLKVENLIFNRAHSLNLNIPQELSATLFSEKFELQRSLMESEFYKSFENTALINPYSPKDINLKVLESMGYELVEKFTAKSKV